MNCWWKVFVVLRGVFLSASCWCLFVCDLSFSYDVQESRMKHTPNLSHRHTKQYHNQKLEHLNYPYSSLFHWMQATNSINQKLRS